MKNQGRFWVTAILAWIVFIGIDFLFHASLLKSLWQEDIDLFKPAIDLFILIPIGYLSFLFLTLLVGYAFTKIYQSKPNKSQAIQFALVFALMYALSNVLGLYSYVDIPLKHLMVYNAVYFIEITSVVFVFYKATYKNTLKKFVWQTLLAFFLMVFVGIIIQNLI